MLEWFGYPSPQTRGSLGRNAPYRPREYRIAASRPDHYIAISSEVKKRIKKYYDKNSEIIFPPLLIEKTRKKKSKDGEFFLLVSRLSRMSYYKKVDLVILAEGYTKSEMEKFEKDSKKFIDYLFE